MPLFVRGDHHLAERGTTMDRDRPHRIRLPDVIHERKGFPARNSGAGLERATVCARSSGETMPARTLLVRELRPHRNDL